MFQWTERSLFCTTNFAATTSILSWLGVRNFGSNTPPHTTPNPPRSRGLPTSQRFLRRSLAAKEVSSSLSFVWSLLLTHQFINTATNTHVNIRSRNTYTIINTHTHRHLNSYFPFCTPRARIELLWSRIVERWRAIVRLPRTFIRISTKRITILKTPFRNTFGMWQSVWRWRVGGVKSRNGFIRGQNWRKLPLETHHSWRFCEPIGDKIWDVSREVACQFRLRKDEFTKNCLRKLGSSVHLFCVSTNVCDPSHYQD